MAACPEKSLLSPHQALSNRGQHSISYTLSRSHSVIVEYTHDSDTDMFQVCSGPSSCLLATSLNAQLYTPSRGRLEGQRPWTRCFEGLSAVDPCSDEEAGHPSKGHIAGSRCIKIQTQGQTPQLWEDIQFRGSECESRTVWLGSRLHSLVALRKSHLSSPGLAYLIAQVGPRIVPTRGVTGKIN